MKDLNKSIVWRIITRRLETARRKLFALCLFVFSNNKNKKAKVFLALDMKILL